MDHGEQQRMRAWLKATNEVVTSGNVTALCPQNGDAPLQAEWIAASSYAPSGRGEYRLFCPACGAENYVLVRRRESAGVTST